MFSTWMLLPGRIRIPIKCNGFRHCSRGYSAPPHTDKINPHEYTNILYYYINQLTIHIEKKTLKHKKKFLVN